MKPLSRKCLTGWIAAGTLSLSACSSTPFAPPTPARIETTPAACLTECGPIPEPSGPGEGSLKRWELETVQAFERCKRLHGECVAGVKKRTRSE